MSTPSATQPALGAGGPSDPNYRLATETFNLAARITPELALVARTTGEVVEAVNRGRRAGLGVRVTSTGHGATAKRSFDGALLIRTDLTGGVRVDPATRTATVPAGTRWGSVVTAAAEHGLVALHGSSPSVGAVGYLLRGGVSFYGRQWGLAVNSLRSISIVLADGSQTVASRDREPALFWALRGGGGGFGVVTEVEIELYPMSAIVTGATIWDAEHASQITASWGRWTRDAPPQISTSLRLMNLPPGPGVPPLLTGRQILVIDGAVTAQHPRDLAMAQATAKDLLGPLRTVAAPMMDSWHAGSPVELLQTHMDPPAPLPYAGHHILVSELGDDGIERFVTASGPQSGPPALISELRQLGGAFAAPRQPGGVLDRTPARYAHMAIDVVPPSHTVDFVTANLRQVGAALAPWGTGLTVPSVVEAYDAVQRTFDDRTAADVADLRRDFDPDSLFAGDVDRIRDGRSGAALD